MTPHLPVLMNPLLPILFWSLYSIFVWGITSRVNSQNSRRSQVFKYFWVLVISMLVLRLVYALLPIPVPTSVAIHLLFVNEVLLAPVA